MSPTQAGPTSEEIVRLRQAVMRLARHLRTTSTEEGLTPTQSSVLANLVRNGHVSLTELARFEGVNPTMLSRVLGGLEERGLLVREQDEEDRRSARARATAKGKRLVERLRDRRAKQ